MTKISLELSYFLRFSFVEITGSYSSNKNIIELTLGTRGENFSWHFKYFSTVFPELWKCIFSGKNKENAINLLSAEYSQRVVVVMVKDKPYICMCVKNGSNPECYQKIWSTIRFQISKLVDIFFSFSDTHIIVLFRSSIGYLDRPSL